MALTFNDSLGELLQARIMEVMTEQAQELASGAAGVEIYRYREIVGYVRGLHDSLEYLAEVRKKLEER